jgi:hypothetical protein
MPSLFGPLKRCVILILKELQIRNSPSSNALLLRLNESTIKQNISIVYYKFFQFYKTYDVRLKLRVKE